MSDTTKIFRNNKLIDATMYIHGGLRHKGRIISQTEDLNVHDLVDLAVQKCYYIPVFEIPRMTFWDWITGNYENKVYEYLDFMKKDYTAAITAGLITLIKEDYGKTKKNT